MLAFFYVLKHLLPTSQSILESLLFRKELAIFLLLSAMSGKEESTISESLKA